MKNCPICGKEVGAYHELTFKEPFIKRSVKPTTNKMAKTIRAKFNVAEIAKYGNAGGTKVTLFPVMGQSEENKAFWQATPSGKIEMHISNPDAEFEFGEYYIDFTKADVQ